MCLGSSQYDTYVSYLFTGIDKAKFVDFLAGLEEYHGDDCSDKFDGSFFGWEYCCLNNGVSPNFFDKPNEAMIELCDDEKFNDFVVRCALSIKAFLEFSPEN